MILLPHLDQEHRLGNIIRQVRISHLPQRCRIDQVNVRRHKSCQHLRICNRWFHITVILPIRHYYDIYFQRRSILVRQPHWRVPIESAARRFEQEWSPPAASRSIVQMLENSAEASGEGSWKQDPTDQDPLAQQISKNLCPRSPCRTTTCNDPE